MVQWVHPIFVAGILVDEMEIWWECFKSLSVALILLLCCAVIFVFILISGVGGDSFRGYHLPF